MDIFSQSEQLKQALKPFIQKIVDERTRECLRTYKAKVVSIPNANTGLCEVQLVGNSTILSLPYSTALNDVSVNDMVWVATTYNSWRNAVVWQKIKFDNDISIGKNGKSAYEIWLEQGNEGTEDDFLASLKGDQGEKGDPGTTGVVHLVPKNIFVTVNEDGTIAVLNYTYYNPETGLWEEAITEIPIIQS